MIEVFVQVPTVTAPKAEGPAVDVQVTPGVVSFGSLLIVTTSDSVKPTGSGFVNPEGALTSLLSPEKLGRFPDEAGAMEAVMFDVSVNELLAGVGVRVPELAVSIYVPAVSM